MRRLGWIAISLLLLGSARAEDRPVAGERLALSSRRISLVLADPAIRAPFSPPATSAGFVFDGGAQDGQCHFEERLDPSGWRQIGGAGAQNGWIYRGARGSAVEWILLRPGRISVHGHSSAWSCSRSAPQRAPRVEVRLGDDRYCAAFASPERNENGRFLAVSAPAPESCAKTDLTAATINILHGVTGAGCFNTAACRLADRIDLLFEWIGARGCPDVVTLQEVSDAVAQHVQEHLSSGVCPFTYELVYQRASGVDDALILSRYPVASMEVLPLLHGFRRIVSARIDHPLGPLRIFTTHLASSSDGATAPCGVGCPAECIAANAETVRECQAVQAAAFVAARHAGETTPALFTGDFNEHPDSFVYQYLSEQGLTDVYLAAGNPECVPASGLGCTSGRADQDLSQLESPALNENERIDYIFLVPPSPGALCAPALDGRDDSDGDGTGTRLFAGAANPFSSQCGAAPLPICWPSDHTGVEVDLDCGSR